MTTTRSTQANAIGPSPATGTWRRSAPLLDDGAARDEDDHGEQHRDRDESRQGFDGLLERDVFMGFPGVERRDVASAGYFAASDWNSGSTSTLPPLRITPTRRPGRRAGRSRGRRRRRRSRAR